MQFNNVTMFLKCKLKQIPILEILHDFVCTFILFVIVIIDKEFTKCVQDVISHSENREGLLLHKKTGV